MKKLSIFWTSHKNFIKRMLYGAPVETKAIYYVYAKVFWEKKVKFFSYLYKRRLAYRYGIYIGENCKIGKNLMLPHPQGIVIGNNTVIGDNVAIYQQVTLGGMYLNYQGGGRKEVYADNLR